MIELGQKEKRAFEQHMKNREAIIKRYPINEQSGILDNWEVDKNFIWRRKDF